MDSQEMYMSDCVYVNVLCITCNHWKQAGMDGLLRWARYTQSVHEPFDDRRD